MLLCVVVFVFSGYQLVAELIDARRGQKATDLAQSLSGISQEILTQEMQTTEQFEEVMDPNVQMLRKWDAAALQEKNPDVVGWIYVPDTVISYPILHAEDNNTYLRTSWTGEPSRAGSIILEANNQSDFRDFHTILYGHHMRNGTMFADIVKYKDDVFQKDHPYVYVATANFVGRYQVFAAYETPADSDVYCTSFADETQKQQVLQSYLAQRKWAEDLEISTLDQILTLSTCTGDGGYENRWVVQAVLTDCWEI